MEKNNIESDRDKIAKRLKQARILAGLSQEQSSAQIGIQRPTISEIEAGRRKVSAEEIIRFAEVYEVDPDWLLLYDQKEGMPESTNYKFAARELGKLKQEDINKVLDLIKIFQK
jgi:transcriptional regulator with XRE-family HTH domain